MCGLPRASTKYSCNRSSHLMTSITSYSIDFFSRKLRSKRAMMEFSRKERGKMRLQTRVGSVHDKNQARAFLLLVCVYTVVTFSALSMVPALTTGKHRYFFENLWRRTHHGNDAIREIQTIFPVHVGDDLETIEHPGFLLSDQKLLEVIFGEMEIPRTIDVPRFWDPPAYGKEGVREFLGENGQRLISSEEAVSIGSFDAGRETIFVAVASYRDPECLPTIEDIYLRAKYPERIRVAIVDQRVQGDASCSTPTVPCKMLPEQVLCKYGHLIDSMDVAAQIMVGPVFARHLAHRMYRGEYFAMQVDSHVRFVQNWDEDIISQWGSTKNEMAVLSTYLSDITNSIDSETHGSLREARSIMCRAEYEWAGSLMEHVKYGVQPTYKPRIKDTPLLNPFWAAGFSFARGHFVVQVPYDQYLPMVFQGEEISMTLRGFTFGYDYYAPSRNTAFHIYAIRENLESRSKVSKFTENEVIFPGAKANGYARLNGMVGATREQGIYFRTDEDKYGCGQVRQRGDFFRIFGIHTDTREVEDDLCDFVQGFAGESKSMHEIFTPNMRTDAMGIDYRLIDYHYVKRGRHESFVDKAELERLGAMLRKRTKP